MNRTNEIHKKVKGGKMEENISIVSTSTAKKENVWKWATFVLVIMLVAVAFYTVGSKNSTSGNVVNNPTNPNTQQAPTQPSQVTASADDDPVLGSKNAKVTMIEFSDYQCPFCRKFWTETYPQIKKEYIDTGKVKFVYRDFPLSSIHPAAEPAAEAANCVREQGGGDEAYLKMQDKIIQEGNILDGGDPNTGPVRGNAQFGTTELKKWAKDLGYNIDDCLDSGKFKSEVQKDLSDATSAGGQGTPYFVINGKPLSGAQPYSAFKQVIDSEL